MVSAGFFFFISSIQRVARLRPEGWNYPSLSVLFYDPQPISLSQSPIHSSGKPSLEPVWFFRLHYVTVLVQATIIFPCWRPPAHTLHPFPSLFPHILKKKKVTCCLKSSKLLGNTYILRMKCKILVKPTRSCVIWPLPAVFISLHIGSYPADSPEGCCACCWSFYLVTISLSTFLSWMLVQMSFIKSVRRPSFASCNLEPLDFLPYSTVIIFLNIFHNL